MLISAIKIIFLLGFLILIHEGGHFLVAKICNVKVNQFAIGFGPKIFQYQGKETLYALRLIPLGGFVSMEGESGSSEEKRAFSNAKISKRIAIVAAGAIVNIIFGLILYLILARIYFGNFSDAIRAVVAYFYAVLEGIKMLFTGNVGINDLTGPVGISNLVSQTVGIKDYIYMMSIISVSLGVTNLLPLPALDGGKIVLLILEAIRKKPLKEETEAKIQLLGFSLLIVIAVMVTYNDILKIAR